MQTTRYQKVSVDAPALAVKLWRIELSPANGPVLPTRAEAAPLCAVVEVPVLPALVHPVSPLSKPPFVIPFGGAARDARYRRAARAGPTGEATLEAAVRDRARRRDRQRHRRAARGARTGAGDRDRVAAGRGRAAHREHERGAATRGDRRRAE